MHRLPTGGNGGNAPRTLELPGRHVRTDAQWTVPFGVEHPALQLPARIASGDGVGRGARRAVSDSGAESHVTWRRGFAPEALCAEACMRPRVAGNSRPHLVIIHPPPSEGETSKRSSADPNAPTVAAESGFGVRFNPWVPRTGDTPAPAPRIVSPQAESLCATPSLGLVHRGGVTRAHHEQSTPRHGWANTS